MTREEIKSELLEVLDEIREEWNDDESGWDIIDAVYAWLTWIEKNDIRHTNEIDILAALANHTTPVWVFEDPFSGNGLAARWLVVPRDWKPIVNAEAIFDLMRDEDGNLPSMRVFESDCKHN